MLLRLRLPLIALLGYGEQVEELVEDENAGAEDAAGPCDNEGQDEEEKVADVVVDLRVRRAVYVSISSSTMAIISLLHTYAPAWAWPRGHS